MPRKVVINSEDILRFVERLSVDVSRFHCQFIPEKISVKELKGGLSAWGAENALTGIVIGLVLANYQPELAAVAVKQMDRVDSDSANNLLKSVLSCYQHYTEGKTQIADEYTQWIEISNWYLPRLWG